MRFASFGLIIWIWLAAPAFAASALDATRTTLEQARSIAATDQGHNEKLAALSGVFDDFLDTDTMGRQALGAHWSTFTPEQQKQFLALFRELFKRTYVQKLLLFDNPKFTYVSETQVDGATLVETNIVTPNDNFAVVYRLRPKGSRWIATGITVEDVSLTANLGSQLDHMLSREKPEDLLDFLQKKYGHPEGESAP
jgi:phospholipid transport system substrate-binding protein